MSSDDPETRNSVQRGLMEYAWVGFINYAVIVPAFHDQYEQETGRRFLRGASSPIAAAIDQATGYDLKIAESMMDFVIWVTIRYWGEGEAPEKMKPEIEEWKKKNRKPL